MPWKETDPMHERVQFIAAYLNPVYSMTELCEPFGIRRNTGYQWVRRDPEPGLAGLQEKSRAPTSLPPPPGRGGRSRPMGSQAGAPARGAAQAPALPRTAPTRSAPAGAVHRWRALPARGAKPST
jgi:putative transposase